MEDKPLTFDEILSDKNYQAEFDKRVAKAIETATNNAKTKWEEEYQKKMEEEKSEADKLAKMKENEKYEYAINQANKKMNDAIAELNAYKLREEVFNRASEKGLNTSLLSDLDFKTLKAEDIDNIIETRKSAFDKAVENAMNERYKEKTPENIASTTPKNTSMPMFF